MVFRSLLVLSFLILSACGGGGGGGATSIAKTSSSKSSASVSSSSSSSSSVSSESSSSAMDSSSSLSSSSSNSAPVIQVEENYQIEEGESFTISASVTDDGLLLTYQWRQISGINALLEGESTTSLTLVAPQVDADTQLTFELSVTDDEGLSSTQSVLVTVTNKPEASYTGIKGRVTFERMLFNVEPNSNYRLNLDEPVELPAQKIVVGLYQDEKLVKQTITNQVGEFAFDFDVGDEAGYYDLVVKAQLELDGEVDDGFKILVTDKSSASELAQQRVYSYKVAKVFFQEQGIKQDVYLDSGWNSAEKKFEADKSFAQPFAILDSIRKATDYFALGGVQFNDGLQNLYVNWTRSSNSSERDVGFYDKYNNRIFLNGDLTKVVSTEAYQADLWAHYVPIEEWNETTIIHEFTHFFMHKVYGRDDTEGNTHWLFGVGDIRMAFSEGIATAIANAVLGTWSGFRVSPDLMSVRSYDDIYAIALNGSNCTSHSTNSKGESYIRDCYPVAPFIETTVIFYLMSVLDAATPESRWTENLGSDIGIKGTLDALQKIRFADSFTSLFSFHSALLALNPDYLPALNRLANKLNLSGSDEWGSGQQPLDSLIMYGQQLLPENTYLPLYSDLVEGNRTPLCFNGGVSYGSLKRPGTMRFVKFVANRTGMVTVRVPNVFDLEANEHSYYTSAYFQGANAENLLLFPGGNLDSIEFMARAGKTYVISVFGNIYQQSWELQINETVCTDISVVYQ